jgi:hypothetical protein
VASRDEIHTVDQPPIENGGRRFAAAPSGGAVAARVRTRLGVMLVMVVVAAGVVGATLGILVVGHEPSAAIAAAAVLFAVTLVMAVVLLAERRRLRRDATSPPVLAVVQPSRPAATGNGSDLIVEAPRADAATKNVRGQADLLEEILHWPAEGA